VIGRDRAQRVERHLLDGPPQPARTRDHEGGQQRRIEVSDARARHSLRLEVAVGAGAEQPANLVAAQGAVAEVAASQHAAIAEGVHAPPARDAHGQRRAARRAEDLRRAERDGRGATFDGGAQGAGDRRPVQRPAIDAPPVQANDDRAAVGVGQSDGSSGDGVRVGLREESQQRPLAPFERDGIGEHGPSVRHCGAFCQGNCGVKPESNRAPTRPDFGSLTDFRSLL